MTGSGKRGRPQTATPEERKFRQLLKNYGYRCEAVSFLRGHVYEEDQGEHTAVICYPPREVGEVVELFTRKHWSSIQVTRIHIPSENQYGQPAIRVYLRWSTKKEMGMWTSPNGVDHLQPDHDKPCLTCGDNHFVEACQDCGNPLCDRQCARA